MLGFSGYSVEIETMILRVAVHGPLHATVDADVPS